MASKTRAPSTGDLITRITRRGGRLHRLKWKQHQGRDMKRERVRETEDANEGGERVYSKHVLGDEA